MEEEGLRDTETTLHETVRRQQGSEMAESEEQLRQMIRALELEKQQAENRATEAEEQRAAANTAKDNAIRERDAARVGGGTLNTAGATKVSILKVEPPSLDDFANYRVWKKRLKTWQAGTGSTMTDKQQACAIIHTITDDHKKHKLGLGTLMMETFTEEEAMNPTVDKVIKFLDSQLILDQYEDIYVLWKDLMQCTIKPGETWAAFITRFDTRWQALHQRDPELKIPDKFLVLMLRDAAGLSATNMMNVRANIKWTDANLYQKTKQVISEICAMETYKGSNTASVKLVTEDREDTVTCSNGCFFVNGIEMVEKPECYALEEKKEGRKCFKCGKIGHISPNCPENKKKNDGGQKKARGRGRGRGHNKDNEEEEHYLIEARVVEEFKRGDCLVMEAFGDGEDEWLDWAGAETISEASGDETQQCYLEMGDKKSQSFTDEAEGAAGLDTCCSRTIMGQKWFDSYKDLLPKEMKKEIVGPLKTNLNFLFGDGGNLNSLGKYQIPVEVHGHRTKIIVELVPSDIPLLFSKTSMTKAGMVVNLKNRTLEAFGERRNLQETSLGHPIVSVIPILRDPIVSDEVLTLEEAVNVQMTKQEQIKMINKIHKQAGHPSKATLKNFLMKGKTAWDKKVVAEELDRLARECKGCIIKKRTPDKPAACIPVADGFNQCVGMDLRIKSDGTIILYVIDIWSKLLQARIVKSKKSEEVVAAIMECWVAVFGSFESTLHDNGGEFVGKAFKDMVDLMGVRDRTTGAHSPWSAGVVERHHAVCDRTYDSLCKDFPHYKKELLLQWAVMIKNSQPTARGWSPFQVVYGKNPVLPNLMDSPISAMREEVTSEALMQNMNALAKARVKFNEQLCDSRAAKMIKSKLRRNQTVFRPGDHIFWRAHHTAENWEQGKVLAEDGKLLFVRNGSRLYRVSADMAVLDGEEFDREGKLIEPLEEETDKVTETQRVKETDKGETQKKRRRRRVASLTDGEEDEEDARPSPSPQQSNRQLPPSPPPQAPSGPPPPRSPSGTPPTQSETSSTSPPASPEDETPAQLSPSSAHLTPSPPSQTPSTQQQDQLTEEDMDTEVFDSPGVTARQSEAGPSRADYMVMAYNELRNENRKRKSEAGHDETISSGAQAKKRGRKRSEPRPACVGRRLSVKAGELIKIEGINGVNEVKSREKKTGKYYNRYNLEKQDKSAEFNVDLGQVKWTRWRPGDRTSDTEESLVVMNGVQEEVQMNIIPFHMHGNQECVQAKKDEVKKIAEEFKAVKVVDDVGQFKISSRFVLWHKKHSDGRVQVRARLVARGYEERDEVPSDSPTMDQTTLKLVLAIANSRDMEIDTADVKSAFLQGLPFTDDERTVTVIPPPEAGLPPGKVWQLVVSLYGLDDASLRFHWKVKQVFTKLGLKQSKFDPALFFAKDNRGELMGVIGTHVDDFIMAGKRPWLNDIMKKIKDIFLMGKVETGSYLYCGHRISTEGGKLTLDQRDFANEIKPLVISPARKRQDDEAVSDKERSIIRSYAGKLGWLGRTTRPDLLFAQIEASSCITKAKVRDLKSLAKAVNRVAGVDSIQTVPKLPRDVTQWKMELFTDASWQNLAETGSTAGRVMVLSGGGQSYPVFWASNRLRRVCHSSQQAEIMAMNSGVAEASYVEAVLEELTGVKVPIELSIDNKNAYSSITSTTAPTAKYVRREAAGVREALMEGDLKRIKLIKGKVQLADPLTKKRASADDLLHVIQSGSGLGSVGL